MELSALKALDYYSFIQRTWAASQSINFLDLQKFLEGFAGFHERNQILRNTERPFGVLRHCEI